MRLERIKEKIKKEIPELSKLLVDDESHKHSGRAGTQSHFKVYVVSDSFTGQSRVNRQKLINEILKEEFENGMHALSMRLLTTKEEETATTYQTPNCESKK